MRLLYFAIVLLLTTSFGIAYNREAAVEYALQWSAPDGNANTVIYYLYNQGGLHDCANFVSQCLVQGGIHFRSSENADDNTRTPLFGSDFPELETGYDTVSIKSDDTISYSRVIVSANQLSRSIISTRHGGKLYICPNEYNDLWSDVTKGDICFLWNEETQKYTHCMFINDLKYSDPKDFYYCAHSDWRHNNKAMDVAYLNNWPNDGHVRFVSLPDAPIVKSVGFWSGNDMLQFQWADKKWHGTGKKIGGNKELFIQITFDTNMDPTKVPNIYVHNDAWYARWLFNPIQGANYSNGWWVASSQGSLKKYRTWCGSVKPWSLIDPGNFVVTIQVNAIADDGTSNDSNNELSKFSPGEMDYFKVQIDTRKTTGKTNE